MTTRSNVGQAVTKSSVVNSVASAASSSEKSLLVPNGEVRDEIVRAVMPELRVLMQHLVNSAVERSIAPLLDKQRDLEAALKQLQEAQVRPAQPASAPVKHASEVANAIRTVHVETNPFVTRAEQTTARDALVPAVSVARPAVRERAEVVPSVAYDSNALADIPMELNGSRRRKTVAWAFAVVVAVLLISVVGLSVLSNMGTQI